MVIHFFIDTSFPYGMAAAKRRLCYAKGLIAAGDQVKVHICHKCFNKNENDGFPAKGIYENIYYTYINGKYKRNNKILRGLDWIILDYIHSFFYSLREIKQGEAIYVYMYPNFIQILLLIAAHIKKVKIVKETCEHPMALGNSNSKWHKICKWFEFKFIMPWYDGFIPISRSLNNFVNKYKKETAQSIIVPILVDEENINIDFKNLSSPYNVPYILHTGTMLEQKDSISKIIKIFAKYKKRYKSNLKLVFTGPQANEKCQYIPLMKRLEVRDDIELLGLVSVEKIAILQHFASMSIIYKSDNLQTRNCFPTKLGEMLINGIPIITTSIGDTNLYLKDGVNAIIINPNDDEKFIEAIHSLLINEVMSHKLGSEGKLVAQKYFNPIYQGKRLSKFFHQLY